MPEITTCLWFVDDLAQAIEHYGEVFGGVVVHEQMMNPPGSPGEGLLMATFEVAGRRIMGLNGGPHDPHTDAMSLFVGCPTQQEADQIWDAFVAGGATPVQCGWLNDRFGVRWQIVPDGLGEAMSNPDPEAAARVFTAFRQMQRIDIAALHAAAAGS